MLKMFGLYTLALVWGVIVIGSMGYVWRVFRKMGKKTKKPYVDIFKED